MKRGKSHIDPLADAILTADWHLREDVPICRMDDFSKAQWDKVDFVNDLQRQHNCSVICAGDLFHHWKPSPLLLTETIKHLPKKFFAVYGQHDLPQHNFDLAYKCGIATLYEANELKILEQCHWNQEPKDYWEEHPENIDEVLAFKGSNKVRLTLVWHRMTYTGSAPFPGCTDPPALTLLKKYPQYDLIVTGDNHKPFVVEHEGRLLVNPGCLTRQKADEAYHRPRVYLWYAKENKVKPVYLPIEQGVVSREHIERAEQRDGRIEAFVSRLDDEWKEAISFEENFEQFFQINKISQTVKNIIYKAVEKL